MRQLLEVDYPRAKLVTLVCDNLNTHDIASLYFAFDAETAHRLARRLRLVFHAQERQLVEHGGDGTEPALAPMPGLPPFCNRRRNGSPRPSLGARSQHPPLRHQLAFHHRRRQNQTQSLYPIPDTER